MQQHKIKAPVGARHKHKRLGIGDSFAGRGVKGQLKRSGKHKALRAGFEGGQISFFRRMPKLGGFKNINRIEFQPINLSELEKMDGTVNAGSLKKAGMIKSAKKPVKILGFGSLTKKLEISVHGASAAAKAAIEKAGGTLTLIDPRSKARQEGAKIAGARAEIRAARKAK